jgi:hypothetical protein
LATNCVAVLSDGDAQLRWAEAVQAAKQSARSLLQQNKLVLHNSNQHKRASNATDLGVKLYSLRQLDDVMRKNE